MAKEAVSPIERHLEKGVLALAVLLFAGAVVRYLVSSPNTTAVDGRQVGPAEIYQIVADEGRALREHINNYREDVEPVRAADLSSPTYAAAALPRPVSFGPQVPVMQSEDIGNIDLVALPKPTQPKVIIGRSGAVLAPQMSITALPEKVDDYYLGWNTIEGQDEGYIDAVNWVTVATTCDVGAQRQAALKANYAPGRAVPYVVGVDLQRRERRWDGTYPEWGEQSIPTYAPLILKGAHDPSKLPYLKVEEHAGKMRISDEMREEIIRFEKIVENPDYRLELMRPMPPRVAYGDYWLYAGLEEALGVNLRLLDDEVIFGEEEGNCPLWDRYPKPPKGPRVDIEKDLRARERVIDRELDVVQGWIDQGCYEAAVGQLLSFQKSSLHLFTAKQVDRLESMLDDAETQWKRDKDKPKGPRELSPVQVLWTHDALRESVVSGKVYQYRMRVLMYNNYAGAAAELNNPEEAEVVLRESEWSDPSEDVRIPYDTDFYLVGKKERDRTAKIDVFKWHKGTWLKSAFRVGVGELIGGRSIEKIDKERVSIDFSTGATVVDLDFDRPYRARRERRGEISWSDPKPTLAMVYVDSAGKLYERLLDADKRSESYKAMKGKVGTAGATGP